MLVNIAGRLRFLWENWPLKIRRGMIVMNLIFVQGGNKDRKKWDHPMSLLSLRARPFSKTSGEKIKKSLPGYQATCYSPNPPLSVLAHRRNKGLDIVKERIVSSKWRKIIDLRILKLRGEISKRSITAREETHLEHEIPGMLFENGGFKCGMNFLKQTFETIFDWQGGKCTIKCNRGSVH